MQACFECWVSWRSVASSLFELEDKLACFLKGSISQFFSHITGRVQVASCTPFNLCFSIFALFFIKKIQNKQRSSRRKRVLLSPLSIIWCIWFLLLTVTKKTPNLKWLTASILAQFNDTTLWVGWPHCKSHAQALRSDGRLSFLAFSEVSEGNQVFHWQ